MNMKQNFRIGHRSLLLLAFLIAGTVFAFTYTTIDKRTQSSLELLQGQGQTLLTILIQSADNAIRANGYFWESFISRVSPVAQLTFEDYDSEDALVWLHDNAPEVTALSVYQFNDRLALISSATNTDIEPHSGIESDFFEAASALLADTTAYQSLIFLQDSLHESITALFLEIDSTRSQGLCMALDFPDLWEMENDIGIGPLIQRLGEAPNVVYILFQDPDGLVFSSTEVDSALAIDADPFLSATFAGDTSTTRVWSFQGEEVIEFVEPFTSTLYPAGLFRLGISLERFTAAKSEFNRQMIALALILFLVAALIPLYLGLRKERTALGISLARTQSLSATILESMRSGVIAINSDNSVELVNQQIGEMFCLGEDLRGARDWRRTGLADFLPADIFERENIVESENVTTHEFEVVVAGERKCFLYTVAVIPSDGSGDSGKALVMYDYTHQRELEASNARRERLVELGDLAAGVAHEIRNPLNAISLAAQRLDAEFSEQITTDRKEFSFFTSQINKETTRLDGIVSRLLGLTRAPKLAPEIHSVGEVIEEWLRFMQPELERDSVTLVAEVDLSIVARFEKDKLRQALGNLYRNSVEAFADKNEPRNSSSERLKMLIELEKTEETVCVVVSDNGPGISEEIVGKLFTPYFTTKAEGSGLGLSICFRLIADMGGALEYDSSYADGARFTITLPT